MKFKKKKKTLRLFEILFSGVRRISFGDKDVFFLSPVFVFFIYLLVSIYEYASKLCSRCAKSEK